MSQILVPDCSQGPGLSDVWLTNPGGSRPFLFPTSDFVFNRSLNEHWQIAFDLRMDDLIGYIGQIDRLRGKWVRYQHPTLGLWTGIIVDVKPDPDSRIVDCTAFSHGWRLKKRVTPRLDRALTGPPGAIVQQVITSVGRDDPLPIAGVDADEVGEPITYEFRAQKVDDVIRAVQSRSNQEWYVEPSDRRLKWRSQVGTDLTGSVQLVDSIHLADYTLSASLEGMTNAVLAQPSDDRYRATRGYWETRGASIDLYGRLEETKAYAGAVVRSSIRPIVKRDLERLSRRGRSLQVQVVDTDRCFSWFGLGDTIRVVLSRLNVAYDYRITAQSYRSDTGVLTCSGYIP